MIRAITPEALKALVDAGLGDPELPGGRVRVFDVRNADAYLAGHVPGSDQVPHSHVVRWIPQQCNTQELVVLVDDAGEAHGEARHVAAELTHKWFRRVRYLAGGLAAWRAAGFAIEQNGVAGPGAASNDGTEPEYQRSAAVPWRAVAPASTPRL